MFKEMASSREMTRLATTHSNQTHIPLWTGGEDGKEVKSRLFVRSGLSSKDRQVYWSEVQQQVLVFQAWVMMIKSECDGKDAGQCNIADISVKLSKQVQAAANTKAC